jgi:hypothetical protein
MSDASRNAVFRTDNFSYQMPTDWWLVIGRFAEEPASATLRGFGVALVIATVSARLGLARGNWLRSVRR